MDVTQGFAQDPAQKVELVFRQIHHDTMAQLPFCQPDLTVKAAQFQNQDGLWVGALLTPWMLSLLVLPASGTDWPERIIGSKVGLSLAAGDFTFTVGEHQALGQYLACSLMSPLTGVENQQQAEQLLQDVSRLAWALPIQTESVDQNKRQLFKKVTAPSPAAV